MPNAPTFDQVCGEFRQFRYMVGKAMASTNESGIRDQLANVTRSMDKNFAELLEAYPQAQAKLEQRRVRTQQNIQQIKQNAARVKAELAAAEKAKAAAAAAPEVPKAPKPPAPVDPKLGLVLRGELLQRLADPTDDGPIAAAAELLGAWEDWDGNALEPK